MKLLYALIFINYSISVLGQVENDSTASNSASVEPFIQGISTFTEYVKVVEMESYRYPTAKYTDRNVRIEYKSPVFIIFHYNDSGQLTIKYENEPFIQEHSLYMAADSIKMSEIDTTTIGESRVWPNPIITQRIEIRKSGNYWEYYPNGQVKIHGMYKFDRKWGDWKYYDIEGNLIREESLENGLQQKKIDVG
jgi:hypothetical protein